ncbi:hypothetical protein SLA2020_346800 [Shorea laevis]
MRPTAAANTTPSTNLKDSPVPYLFGSLGLVFLLIAVALVTLLCSYCRRRSSPSSLSSEEKPQILPISLVIDAEPKIAVIMPGDDKPTHLAEPVTSTTTPPSICRCQHLQEDP